MVREFLYRGDRFRATVHGHAGKEEIFVVQVLEDDDEGPEISLDRFEDKHNDPGESLESVLARLVERMQVEQQLTATEPTAGFTWSTGKVQARVHSGVQQ